MISLLALIGYLVQLLNSKVNRSLRTESDGEINHPQMGMIGDFPIGDCALDAQRVKWSILPKES